MDNSPYMYYLIIDADNGHDLALKMFKIYECDMADMEKVKAVADQIVQITYDNVIVNSGVCLPPSGNIVRAGNKEVSELQETFLGTVLGPLLLIQSILRNRSWTGGCHLVFILKEPINYMKKHWPNESWWTDEKSEGETNSVQVYYRSKAALASMAEHLDGRRSPDIAIGYSKPLTAMAVHPGFYEVEVSPKDESVCSPLISLFQSNINIKEVKDCATFVMNVALVDYTINDTKKVRVNAREGWVTSPQSETQRNGLIKYILGLTQKFIPGGVNGEPVNSIHIV